MKTVALSFFPFVAQRCGFLRMNSSVPPKAFRRNATPLKLIAADLVKSFRRSQTGCAKYISKPGCRANKPRAPSEQLQLAARFFMSSSSRQHPLQLKRKQEPKRCAQAVLAASVSAESDEICSKCIEIHVNLNVLLSFNLAN